MALNFKAGGELTVVDISDSKQLTSFISSTSQRQVIYDPNDKTYSPNYASENNTLIPQLYITGSMEDIISEAKSVQWYYQIDSIGKRMPITGNTTDYTLNDTTKQLTIKTNILEHNISINYLVEIIYTDQETNMDIVTLSQIELIKITNGVDGINGDNPFIAVLSNESHNVPADAVGVVTNLIGASTEFKIYEGIHEVTSEWTVTVEESDGITGVKNSAGVYSVTGMTVDVGYVDFIAQKNTESLTKRFTLTKVRGGKDGTDGVEGVAGENALTMSLTNDIHTVVTDSDGKNGNYDGAYSTAIVFDGIKDDTANWTITAEASSGISGTLDGATYQVIDLTTDSGEVKFTATKGELSLTKFFTITKTKQGVKGVDSTIYRLKKSHAIVIRGKDGFLKPSTVTFESTSLTGNIEHEFSGYYVIHERAIESITIDEYMSLHEANMILPEREYIVSDVEQPYVKRYESSFPEAKLNYMPTDDIVSFHVELYKDAEFTQLLDSEIVMIATDGTDGEDSYRVEIISTQGNIFKNGDIGTTLMAKVYKGSKEITEELNAVNFKWTRASADAAGDKAWNTEFAGGRKSIDITSEDVYVRATFSCQIQT